MVIEENGHKRAGDMAEVVESLPYKHKSPVQITEPPKRK
jgi:hypothetical protein